MTIIGFRCGFSTCLNMIIRYVHSRIIKIQSIQYCKNQLHTLKW
uniref:Uncharacterized protein n=1 Tax=Rhizophora mucronata TaxID=61149 RepID=A0A2P2Q3J7_RHIMU